MNRRQIYTMSSRNYDFQLSQPVWIRSLEAYRISEEALEEGKIGLSDIAQSIEDVNNGATVEALRSAMPVFLEDGIYGQTYRQVKAVRACMEGALPRINALLSWCEQFQKEYALALLYRQYASSTGRKCREMSKL